MDRPVSGVVVCDCDCDCDCDWVWVWDGDCDWVWAFEVGVAEEEEDGGTKMNVTSGGSAVEDVCVSMCALYMKFVILWPYIATWFFRLDLAMQRRTYRVVVGEDETEAICLIEVERVGIEHAYVNLPFFEVVRFD